LLESFALGEASMSAADQDPTPEPETLPPVEREGAVMGFLDHLEELRWTLIKCLAAFLVGFVLLAVFAKQATVVLNRPLFAALGEKAGQAALVTTAPMAVFSVFLQIAFLGGLAVSLPFIVYFAGRFIAPALTRREKRLLAPACLGVLGLFLLGASFGYFLLLPAAIKLSVEFNQMFGFQLIWSADRYYGLLVWMVLGLGMGFQFPMVLLILSYLEIIRLETLRRQRRLMIVVFFIAAALITPPEPVTQTMVALPMILLYEASLVVAGWALRAKRRAAARDEEAEDAEG
jgi:sec-independent protein translocase protein TatC